MTACDCQPLALCPDCRRELRAAIGQVRMLAYQAGRASMRDDSRAAVYLADCSARAHRNVLRMIGSEEG